MATDVPARKRRAYAARVPEAQRRAQLLDAALQLIVTEGHNAATMDAVAAKAGVTKPVVYTLFANRAELLAALLDREQQQALEQLAAVVPDDLVERSLDELDEQLTELLDRFLAAVCAAPQRWYCIVVQMPDMPAEFFRARENARDITLALIEHLTGRLLSRVQADPALDAEITAHMLLGLLESAARLVLTDPERFQPARFAAALRATAAMLRVRSDPTSSLVES